LGDVAEHGDRTGLGSLCHRPELHGREILCLVEDHVPELLGSAQQALDLVDQDRVGQTPTHRSSLRRKPVRYKERQFLVAPRAPAGGGQRVRI